MVVNSGKKHWVGKVGEYVDRQAETFEVRIFSLRFSIY